MAATLSANQEDRPPSSQTAEAVVTPGGDPWQVGHGRLRRLVAYGQEVYALKTKFAAIQDARQHPDHPAPLLASAVFFTGMLRIPSFNALEPRLSEPTFVRLAGAAARVNSIGSADTISRSLRTMTRGPLRALLGGIIGQAERNKVFREGWHGALRYVALDGWEPFASFDRHCDQCLVRKVKLKQRDGTLKEVEQYYHRYVVAMLIDDRLDLALDIEPLLPHDLRPGGVTKGDADEGEQTAAIRLLRRVKQTYHWLDCVVADGLYGNGPFLTTVAQIRMSAIVVARKEKDEPLKEALALWRDTPPQSVFIDADAHERIELWDAPGIRTLSTYDGPIRLVKARVTRLARAQDAPSTWCFMVTGEKATRLPPRATVMVGRGRWHIENTAFHQWTTRWRFGHVFTHHPDAILSLFWIFMAAFDLLTLFLYRQLRCYGRDRGKDVTKTISRLVEEMREDLARLDRSPWVLDSS